MARNKNAVTEVIDVRVNGEKLQAVQTAAHELAEIQGEAAAHARALAVQLGYEGSLSTDALEDGIRFYQQRTAEACLALGARLILLKETSAHGSFKTRLDLLGIEERAARRFMSAAFKFSKRATSPVLEAVNSQSKLLELLVLDDTEIAELEDGGTVRGITADKLDRMSVRELRNALRQSEKDAEFEAGQRQKADIRADIAEKQLKGKQPVVLPLSARISEFQREINERQSLIEKGLLAHDLAITALDAWWTNEATQAPDYDPEVAAPLPPEVLVVAQHLFDGIERLAAAVGGLQHRFFATFGDGIAQSRQYLLQDPVVRGDEGALL